MRGKAWAWAAVAVVAAVLVVAAGAWAVDWYRDGLPRSSRTGDACRVTAAGGLVGIDAATGAVRWTNIVPDGGRLAVADGGVHHQTVWHPEPTDRTIDADTGAVVGCTPMPHRRDGTPAPDPDRLQPGAQVDGLTVVPWGDGLRATDAEGEGVWGTTAMTPSALLGDELLVQTTPPDPHRWSAALIDLRTGEAVWEQPGDIADAEGARDLVLVHVDGPDQRFRALEVRTGEARWETSLDDLRPTVDPRAWEAGDLVVFDLGGDGRIVAVDAATGERRWTATLDAPGRSRRTPETGGIGDVAAVDGETIVVAIDAYVPEDYVD